MLQWLEGWLLRLHEFRISPPCWWSKQDAASLSSLCNLEAHNLLTTCPWWHTKSLKSVVSLWLSQIIYGNLWPLQLIPIGQSGHLSSIRTYLLTQEVYMTRSSVLSMGPTRKCYPNGYPPQDDSPRIGMQNLTVTMSLHYDIHLS